MAKNTTVVFRIHVFSSQEVPSAESILDQEPGKKFVFANVT